MNMKICRSKNPQKIVPGHFHPFSRNRRLNWPGSTEKSWSWGPTNGPPNWSPCRLEDSPWATSVSQGLPNRGKPVMFFFFLNGSKSFVTGSKWHVHLPAFQHFGCKIRMTELSPIAKSYQIVIAIVWQWPHSVHDSWMNFHCKWHISGGIFPKIFGTNVD